MSIERQEYDLLKNYLRDLLCAAEKQALASEASNQLLHQIALALLQQGKLLQQIADDLADEPQPADVLGFTAIQENLTMVPLAAGQTATFSTTPIPSDASPITANLIWSSSDTVNAPVSPNSADATGLSTLVAFPSTVVAGVTFSLTLSYTNSDGTTATQTNSFTTVAPAPADVTGFNPIVQSA